MQCIYHRSVYIAYAVHVIMECIYHMEYVCIFKNFYRNSTIKIILHFRYSLKIKQVTIRIVVVSFT